MHGLTAVEWARASNWQQQRILLQPHCRSAQHGGFSASAALPYQLSHSGLLQNNKRVPRISATMPPVVILPLQSVGVVLFISALIRQCTSSNQSGTNNLLADLSSLPDASSGHNRKKESTPSDSGSSVRSSKSKRGKKGGAGAGSSNPASSSQPDKLSTTSKETHRVTNLYCSPSLLVSALKFLSPFLPFTVS